MSNSATRQAPASMEQLRDQLAALRNEMRVLSADLESAEAQAVASVTDNATYRGAAEAATSIKNELASLEVREEHLQKAFESALSEEKARLRAVITSHRNVLDEKMMAARRLAAVRQVEVNAIAEAKAGHRESAPEDMAKHALSILNGLQCRVDAAGADFLPQDIERLASLYKDRIQTQIELLEACPPQDVRIAERAINAIETHFRNHPDALTVRLAESRAAEYRARLSSLEKDAAPLRKRLSDLDFRIEELERKG